MKSTFLICIVAIAVMISAVVGFTTSDYPTKINSKKGLNGIHPEIVYGPALDNPASTLSESFEGSTFPPAGWIKQSTFNNTGWTRQTAGTSPLPGWTGTASITTPPGGGNACAYVTYGDVGSSNNEWLITPQITNVQAGDSLSFWLRYIVPTYADSFEVKISTTTQTIAAMTISVFKKRFTGTNDTGYVRYGFAIGSLVPPGSNIYIGFREMILDNLNDGSAFTLDLINVGGSPPPPSCAYSYTAQTSGTANQLLTVSTVNDQIGWAGGVGPTVIRTTNGSSWTSATGTGITGDVYNIWGVDANTAFCTSSPGATNLYKTTNGGSTWQLVFTAPSPAFIDGIQMVSATEGYAMGDPPDTKWMILKTTNGGDNWSRMATEPLKIGSDAGWNNSFQILGTHMWFGTNGTKVYHSSDLGLTWTNGPTTGTANSYAVHFNSATNGLASGTAVVKSTDGGTTYSSTTSPGTSGNISGLEGAGTDWWATRSDASIYRSTNQGANWTTAHTQTGAVFQDIDFKVVNGCPTGWAVGNAGSVAKMATSTGISSFGTEIPSAYLLKQNFPNPFNPTTNINFSIPKTGFVTLKIFDIAGKEVATLVNEVKNAGNYIVGFNAANLPSGAYFYRIETGSFVDTKKMLLVK